MAVSPSAHTAARKTPAAEHKARISSSSLPAQVMLAIALGVAALFDVGLFGVFLGRARPSTAPIHRVEHGAQLGRNHVIHVQHLHTITPTASSSARLTAMPA